MEERPLLGVDKVILCNRTYTIYCNSMHNLTIIYTEIELEFFLLQA